MEKLMLINPDEIQYIEISNSIEINFVKFRKLVPAITKKVWYSSRYVIIKKEVKEGYYAFGNYRGKNISDIKSFLDSYRFFYNESDKKFYRKPSVRIQYNGSSRAIDFDDELELKDFMDQINTIDKLITIKISR